MQLKNIANSKVDKCFFMFPNVVACFSFLLPATKVPTCFVFWLKHYKINRKSIQQSTAQQHRELARIFLVFTNTSRLRDVFILG